MLISCRSGQWLRQGQRRQRRRLVRWVLLHRLSLPDRPLLLLRRDLVLLHRLSLPDRPLVLLRLSLPDRPLLLLRRDLLDRLVLLHLRSL